MSTVTTREVMSRHAGAGELPERVREALGDLAGAAREGLMALSVGVGLGILAELMEAEVDEVVGPKGRHDPARTAKRHGHEPSSVTLGARRVAVSRPRVRSTEGEREVALSTLGHFAAREALTDVVLERMLAGVSAQVLGRAGRGCDPAPARPRPLSETARPWRAGSSRTPIRPRSGRSARPRKSHGVRRRSGSLRTAWLELAREEQRRLVPHPPQRRSQAHPSERSANHRDGPLTGGSPLHVVYPPARVAHRRACHPLLQ